jgi:quercetin dioxygenase-like cupin family protein
VERFTPEAFAPPDERLEAVTIAPLTAPGRVQAAFFHVAAGGRIARHRATTPQVLAVVEGEGLVSGADGAFEPISAGEAVFWAAGEEHETVSDYGLTALIVEGDGLTLRR